MTTIVGSNGGGTTAAKPLKLVLMTVSFMQATDASEIAENLNTLSIVLQI